MSAAVCIALALGLLDRVCKHRARRGLRRRGRFFELTHLENRGAALLACGGLSNLVDRFARGSVTDYLRFPYLPGRVGRLVWNLADFMILAGAVLALASEIGV